MSHPEFFSGIACPCCLFFKRESRGRQPFGGVCPQGTKSSFTSHTPPEAACERRKKVLGAQPPSPQSRGGCPLHPRRGAFQAPRKFGMTHTFSCAAGARKKRIGKPCWGARSAHLAWSGWPGGT